MVVGIVAGVVFAVLAILCVLALVKSMALHRRRPEPFAVMESGFPRARLGMPGDGRTTRERSV